MTFSAECLACSVGVSGDGEKVRRWLEVHVGRPVGELSPGFCRFIAPPHEVLVRPHGEALVDPAPAGVDLHR